MLTALLHEMAHIAGFIDGYSGFDSHVQTINGLRLFVGPDFTAHLNNDHLDPKVYPADLMNPMLLPSVRELPSTLDVEILNAARSGEGESGKAGRNDLAAPLTSSPLTHILNGSFDITHPSDPNYGWSTRGSTTILNGQAVLSEDSRFNSDFSQTFVVPQGAKYLKFTLLDTTLGDDNSQTPPDAFEVALDDANTMTPLVGTATGLTQTDALLNIQHDGHAHFSPQVSSSAITSSNTLIAGPMQRKVD